jgi:hypothetical protein
MFDEKQYDKEYSKQYYLKNKEKILARQKQNYENNKDIFKERARRYVAKNIEKVKAFRKLYRQKASPEQIQKWNKAREDYVKNNPQKRIIAIIKSRAKQKNMDFNLEPEDIQIPELCPVFKIPLEKYITKGKYGPRYNSPSVDRIDNTKGYIKGNIQIISHKANSMKSNATPEQLLKFAYWVILTYGYLIDKEIS